MSSDDKLYTQAEMEQRESNARVETLLHATREDFKEHAKADEKIFHELFDMIRLLKQDINAIPTTIRECRDDLKREIHSDMEETFVKKEEYNRIKYFVSAVILIGMALSWVVSLFVNVQKLTGS